MRWLKMVSFVASSLIVAGCGPESGDEQTTSGKGDLPSVVNWATGIPKGAKVDDTSYPSGQIMNWQEVLPGHWYGFKTFFRRGDSLTQKVSVISKTQRRSVVVKARLYEGFRFGRLVEERMVEASRVGFGNPTATLFDDYSIPNDGVHTIIATVEDASPGPDHDRIKLEGRCARLAGEPCARCDDDPTICPSGRVCARPNSWGIDSDPRYHWCISPERE